MRRNEIPQEYRVEGIPPAILGKITEFQDAVHQYAFKGAADPLDYDDIIEQLCIARYNLERTIKTYLEK